MATIKVPEETLAEVKSIAEYTGRSSHWVMLEAIKKYVADAQQAIEDEKAWLQSGIDALKNAEKNGYASTSEELAEKIERLKETEWKVGK
jgi:predicted transcriptional regulator